MNIHDLSKVADALDAAWDELRCKCSDDDSGICDCAVAQVGEAREIVRQSGLEI